MGDITVLQGHEPDEDTMNWWKSTEDKSKELERIQANARDVVQVMGDLSKLITSLMKKHELKRMIWIARPASYDWQWLNCYWNEYLLKCSEEERKAAPRMPHNSTCVSTMRDVYTNVNGLTKKQVSEELEKCAQGLEITHNPLDDCRTQAKWYFYLCDKLGVKL
mgnify:CR=1 FL=1